MVRPRVAAAPKVLRIGLNEPVVVLCVILADNHDVVVAAGDTLRRSHRELQQQKTTRVLDLSERALSSHPKSTWRSLNLLVSRGRHPSSAAVSADEFGRFSTTRWIPSVLLPPLAVICQVSANQRLCPRPPITGEMVIGGLLNNNLSADPLAVPVLKAVTNELAPFLTTLFNRVLGAIMKKLVLDIALTFDRIVQFRTGPSSLNYCSGL
jgi:hypothetical protein